MTDLSPRLSLDVPPPRRKRRATRELMLAIVALAGMAAIVAGWWFTLPQAYRDARAIALVRTDRYSRAMAGAALPGSPDLARLEERLREKGLKQGAPVLVRIFKREFELELWMARGGVFEKFATYPICMWSGALGPKTKMGDYQAPEGFYWVAKNQLNPNSKYYRSFNLGFPNAYDQALGRTGSALMVHGACGSVGCYAMTDAQMGEIWTLVTAALDAGQPAFQVQAFPFRLTTQNLDAYTGSPHEAFWRDLAAGSEAFERTRLPPAVNLCQGRYTFEAGTSIASTPPGIGTRCAQASAKN
jgi:murein L,D-transpeptidase YafK